MSQCLICGTDWPDRNLPCEGCQNEFSFQDILLKKASNQRFLFGSVKASPDLVPDKPDKPKTRTKPKVMPQKQASMTPQSVETTPGRVEKPLIMDRPEDAGGLPLDDQTIVRGDEPMTEPPPKKVRGRFLQRIYAHALDVVLCCLLNLGIYNLMVWLSGRDSEKVLHQSLVPVFFVLFSFTALYFWLFKVLFKTSLGTLLIQWVRKR